MRLHPDLPATLSAAEAHRFGLFTAVEGLQTVEFVPAPWGGYLARLTVATPDGRVVRERNVSSSEWQRYQRQVTAVFAGRSATDTSAPASGTETGPSANSDRLRVWPEVPVPSQVAVAGPPPAAQARLRFPSLNRRWFVLLELGYRRNVTDFRDYFTDMGVIGVSWGRMIGRVMPFMTMEVGFGDISDEFESLTGDGRSGVYNFAAGLMLRQPLGRRLQFYASGAYGYFIRSLQWGGQFIDPRTGSYSNGFVMEQQDWGSAFRAGFMIMRKSRDKPRFIDIGLGIQTTRADSWSDTDPDDPTVHLHADDRDTWITLSIRFGDSI